MVADPESGEVIRAIRLLYVAEQGMTAVIDRESIRRRMRELILRLGAPDRAGGTVRIYVERLLAAAGELPDGEPKFAGYVKCAAGRVLDAQLRKAVGRHMGQATVRGRAGFRAPHPRISDGPLAPGSSFPCGGGFT